MNNNCTLLFDIITTEISSDIFSNISNDNITVKNTDKITISIVSVLKLNILTEYKTIIVTNQYDKKKQNPSYLQYPKIIIKDSIIDIINTFIDIISLYNPQYIYTNKIGVQKLYDYISINNNFNFLYNKKYNIQYNDIFYINLYDIKCEFDKYLIKDLINIIESYYIKSYSVSILPKNMIYYFYSIYDK